MEFCSITTLLYKIDERMPKKEERYGLAALVVRIVETIA